MRFNPQRRALVAAAGWLSLAGLAASQTAERSIRITVHKFEFEPRKIVLKQGEPVTLEFTSQDVIMGFNLNAFGLRTDILPGQTTSLRFTPDKAGEFVFYCDVFCGNGHDEMDGMLSVTA